MAAGVERGAGFPDFSKFQDRVADTPGLTGPPIRRRGSSNRQVLSERTIEDGETGNCEIVHHFGGEDQDLLPGSSMDPGMSPGIAFDAVCGDQSVGYCALGDSATGNTHLNYLGHNLR